MNIRFTKMQAFSNDYVYVDAIHQKIEDPGDLAKKISDRHTGVGSDGLVLLCDSEVCGLRMRMFNPDGTEGEMCGNALRSLAKFAYHYGFTKETSFAIETLGGIKQVTLEVCDKEVTNIQADIGKPILDPDMIPVNIERAAGPGPEERLFLDIPLKVEDRIFKVTALSWGNPHCVAFVDRVEDFPVQFYGSCLENMRDIFPNKTNVTFAQACDDSHMKIREWERGTGETLGCATGCCTAVVAGHLLGKCGRKVSVEQPGGVLEVHWTDHGEVHMRGPSRIVYEGEYFYEA